MPISKESVGEERYRELKHDAYLRRKVKLEKKQELEDLRKIKEEPATFAEDAKKSSVFLFYLGVKIGLKLAYTDNLLKELTEEQKQRVDLWSLDMAQRIVEDNWNVERIQQRHVRNINADPTPNDTKFFRIVAKSLDEDEIDVWDYVHRLLIDREDGSEKFSAAYIIEYESGVSQKKVYSTLKHLQKMGVIDFRDDETQSDPSHIQPLYLKRGPDWIDIKE